MDHSQLGAYPVHTLPSPLNLMGVVNALPSFVMAVKASPGPIQMVVIKRYPELAAALLPLTLWRKRLTLCALPRLLSPVHTPPPSRSIISHAAAAAAAAPGR